LACFASVAARADITMTECFSSAPNVYGSPSWNGYLTNALAGIQNGCVATGDPTSPTYYQSGSTFQPGQLIVTDYNSWDGVASPGGAFSQELGNRLHDGLFVTDNGNNADQFSLSELTYNFNSSDPGDSLAYAGSFDASDSYSTTRVGIINNPDGSQTFVTSGSATQKVDELVYVGVGNALCSGSPDDCGGGSFTSIGDLVSYVEANQPFTVTNTYSLVDDNGDTLASVTSVAQVSATPEPAELLPISGIFLVLGFAAWGRYRTLPAKA
jgi:hypothetical protein